MSVDTRLKVFVSCMKRAVRTRFTGSPPRLRRWAAGVIPAPAQAEDRDAMAISFLRIALLGLAPFTPLIAPRAGDKVLRIVPHADLKVLDPHTNPPSLVDRADPRMGVRPKDKNGRRLAT